MPEFMPGDDVPVCDPTMPCSPEVMRLLQERAVWRELEQLAPAGMFVGLAPPGPDWFDPIHEIDAACVEEIPMIQVPKPSDFRGRPAIPKAPPRRVKLFVLDEVHLLSMLRHLSWAGREGKPPVPQLREMWLPHFEADIPEDAEIRGVHYDFDRGAFLVCIEHPSWPEVERGHMIPVVGNRCVFRFALDPRYHAQSDT